MAKCSECGKIIPKKDSVYKDEKTGDIFCGVCYIKHIEKDIGSSEEVLDIKPVKKQSSKFVIFLLFGIILIIVEILMLSETGGGVVPARLPEKKEGVREAGIDATRIFFIHELLTNYKAKYGEFPVVLSLLTPEFVSPEIKDENIVYELAENLGFVLYNKNSKGEATEPILSAKGKIEISRLKTVFP
jgi:hypothetical protein